MEDEEEVINRRNHNLPKMEEDEEKEQEPEMVQPE